MCRSIPLPILPCDRAIDYEAFYAEEIARCFDIKPPGEMNVRKCYSMLSARQFPFLDAAKGSRE